MIKDISYSLLITLFFFSCVDPDPICAPYYEIPNLGKISPNKEKYTTEDVIVIEIAVSSDLSQYGIEDDIFKRTKLSGGDFIEGMGFYDQFGNYSTVLSDNMFYYDYQESDLVLLDTIDGYYKYKWGIGFIHQDNPDSIKEFFIKRNITLDFYTDFDACEFVEIYSNIEYQDQTGEYIRIEIE